MSRMTFRQRVSAKMAGMRERLWPLSGHAMRLRFLKGKYQGKRCFIVGNGPSLSPEDLDRIADEYSFGFNRVYKIFDRTRWRPTFYCSEDPKMLSGSLEEVRKMEVPHKFIPHALALWYELAVPGAIYFRLNRKELVPEASHFSVDAMVGFNFGNTVAYTAMQMAVFMGFSEIILIGVDHSFSTVMDESGKVVTDPSAKDYFDQDYNSDKEALYVPRPWLSEVAYKAVRKYADAHGIRILNATRGGKLEVFERVNFDKITKELEVLFQQGEDMREAHKQEGDTLRRIDA